MPAERYYLSQVFPIGETVLLTDNEFHHLTNVMRGKAGDEIELVNGAGDLATGTISSIEKKKAFITITSCVHEAKPKTTIILAQAIPRINRLDFIVEKCTELGMMELWLFPGDKSERKEFSENQLERSKAIAIGAMKQSGRLYLPEIIVKPRLAKWEKPGCFLLYGDVDAKAPPFKDFWKTSPPAIGAFFIGPESGFSEAEEEILRTWQAAGVHLNDHILRTDTAAIAALTLFSHWLK